jgi:hypothetical protein
VTNQFFTLIPSGPIGRCIVLVIGTGPLVMLTISYQRNARARLRFWEVPAYALAFTAFSYLWVTATLCAWGRMVSHRGTWSKTPRVRVVTGGPVTVAPRPSIHAAAVADSIP